MSARLPVNMDATAPGLNAAEPVPTVGKVGRAYRVCSMAAKLALVPTILVMLFCFYGSVTWTVYISMTRSFLLPVYKFAGAAQYERLFATPRWHVAYSNMFLFGVLDIIGTLVLGVLLAVLLDRAVRFEGIFRTIMLYPLSISFIVTGLTWQWLLSPTIGVQQLGRDLGWTNFVFDWITQPDRAIYTLVFAGIWHQSGLIMAIMLAGLRGVDREIWRAARIEGIPTWRIYVSIILPMLRPLIVTCVVLIAIAVVKSYDLVVAMTNGGPGYSSDLPGKFVVDFEFERANIGQASAAATVMLGSVLAIVSPYLYFELTRKNR
ncbi:MAG: glucose/mannose transport system permease protein [Acetobacteraceae bacterium]|jgi:glucose/mannose transport system permease protein|nr:glucose/mannose transport system permease protein [Acetobacteraceae bacterium]